MRKIYQNPTRQLLCWAKTASRWNDCSYKKLQPNLEIEECVLVNVDKVDRGPLDPPNIMSIFVVTDVKNGVYQFGMTGGIIKYWFNRPDL